MKKVLFSVVLSVVGILIADVAYSSNINEDIDDAILFSVYELSPRLTAVVSNMDESAGEPSEFDEAFLAIDEHERFMENYFNMLYENRIPDNMAYRDTTGIFRIVYNKKVEEAIKPLLQNEFFVYGTKGVERRTTKDVFFSLDECRTNFFAFTLDGFDKSKCGYPVLASDRELNLVYGEDYTPIEDKINEYYSQSELDYRDNTSIKVYAHLNNFYFTYNDDFNWNAKDGKDPACLFPDRAVFVLNDDGTVELFWYDGLDLYGIACD